MIIAKNYFLTVVVFLAVVVVFLTGAFAAVFVFVVVFLAVVVVVLTIGFDVADDAGVVTTGVGVGIIVDGSVAVGTVAAASTVPLILKTTGEFLALELTVTLLEKGPTR
jgi:hypothetical protein